MGKSNNFVYIQEIHVAHMVTMADTDGSFVDSDI
jgi:hypothetical protein